MDEFECRHGAGDLTVMEGHRLSYQSLNDTIVRTFATVTSTRLFNNFTYVVSSLQSSPFSCKRDIDNVLTEQLAY